MSNNRKTGVQLNCTPDFYPNIICFIIEENYIIAYVLFRYVPAGRGSLSRQVQREDNSLLLGFQPFGKISHYFTDFNLLGAHRLTTAATDTI